MIHSSLRADADRARVHAQIWCENVPMHRKRASLSLDKSERTKQVRTSEAEEETRFATRIGVTQNARCFKRLAQSWCAWHGSCFSTLD
jgi:hypothetical protein